jgi:Peptidase C13 family
LALYAILFAGCGAIPAYDSPRYVHDLQRLGDCIIKLQGAAIAQIWVLYGDGTRTFSFKQQHATVLPGSVANLQATFSTIAASAAPADVFIFVASNHGGPDFQGSGCRLWCWNDTSTVTSGFFSRLCSSLSCRRQVFILGQCNSGGFISSLRSPVRLIMTACLDTEESYPSADGVYDEFLLRMAEAIEGGAQSFAQAFFHAKQADTRPEHPQISDDGGIANDVSILQIAP